MAERTYSFGTHTMTSFEILIWPKGSLTLPCTQQSSLHIPLAYHPGPQGEHRVAGSCSSALPLRASTRTYVSCCTIGSCPNDLNGCLVTPRAQPYTLSNYWSLLSDLPQQRHIDLQLCSATPLSLDGPSGPGSSVNIVNKISTIQLLNEGSSVSS